MKTSNHIQRSKIIAIVSLVLGTLLGWIPMLGFLKIAALILMIFAVLNIAKTSKSPVLFKSYILMCLCDILCVFFNFFALAMPIVITLIFFFAQAMPIVITLMILIFTIVYIYFGYKYYKEMRNISGVALFFHCFICRTMGLFLIPISLGIFAFNTTISEWLAAISGIVYGISMILELVAWITLKEVKILGADFTHTEAITNDSQPKTE